MVNPRLSILIVMLVTVLESSGQGTLVFDQGSTNIIEGSSPWSSTPMGQSFTPTLSSMDFVELMLFDADVFHQNGSSLYVTIRSGSISGSILGTSTTVITPDNFFGTALFTFSNSVSLVPGITYFVQ